MTDCLPEAGMIYKNDVSFIAVSE